MNMRNQHDWRTPAVDSHDLIAPATLCQLDKIIRYLCEAAADNMIGVYLHGSLAMGCFNAGTSDIDLLVITQTPLDRAAQRAVLALLLEQSAQPHPIEISIVHYAQIVPWRHPTPYDLHFSEMHRNLYAQAAADSVDAWPGGGVDPDLAAHFTVLMARGICLHGLPTDALSIDVPWDDYVASLRSDFEWSQTPDNPGVTYAVLNACRIWAAITDHCVLSKAEGARWAIEKAPPQFSMTIERSATRYATTGAGTIPELAEEEAAVFLRWLRRRLGW